MRDGFSTFYAGAVDAPWIAYLGGDYTVNEHVGVSLYASQFKDVWNQYYAGTSLSYPLSESVALIGGFNYYRAVDEGKNSWTALITISGVAKPGLNSASTR